VQGNPGTAKGLQLKLWFCENKVIFTSFTWELNRQGFLINTGVDWERRNLCADVEHPVNDGSPLDLQICEIRTDQKWLLTPEGFIKNTLGGKLCVDVEGNPATESLSLVQLYNCEDETEDGSFLSMKWDILSGGFIHNRKYRTCVDVFGSPGRDSGAALTAWNCEYNEPNTDQKWVLGDDGFITNQLSGKCLDINFEKVKDGLTDLMLFPCQRADAETAQRWERTQHGLLKNVKLNQCMQLWQGRLVMARCPTTDQRWELTPGGLLRNKLTGQCLDSAEGAKDVSWRRLVMRTCDPIRQWNVVPSSGQGKVVPTEVPLYVP